MSTERTPMYQRYNYDDVFNRSVIAGLLYLCNHKLTYKQTWDDSTVEEVTIPFAYNFAHAKDQRFAQDNYTFFGRECFSDKLVDGKFDMCPRFAMTYTGSQIESNNITNRFVKGNYMKDENGVLTSYTAFMYSIPVTLNFDFEGWIDNLETAFKIEQAIREAFYKNQTFNVLYRGMKVGCRAGFPDTYTVGEKTVTYGFEQDSQLIKMNFSLSVESYQPCFDESQSIKSENKIENFAFDPDVFNRSVNPRTKKVEIHFNPIDTENVYSVGQDIELSWESSSNSSDVYTVLLYYITPDGDRHIIDCSLRQNNSFTWTIPNTIAKFNQPKITYYPLDHISILSVPEVVVVPENTGYVDTGSFIITDPGKFSDDGLIQLSCEYIDASSNLKIHDGYFAEVTKENGIEKVYYWKDLPESYTVTVMNPKRLKYKKGSYVTPITIGISYPKDQEIKDEIHNILIV